MSVNQFCVFLVVSCLVADLLAEETTTDNSSLSGNDTQDVYEINSVQFEIGVNENMESNATAEPITKDKLSETKVAFLVPPAALFNVTQPSTP